MEALQGDLNDVGYREEFTWRTDEKEKTIKYLGTLEMLADIESMISIGAGAADLDLQLIKQFSPKLTKYIAVEPNPKHAAVIIEKFKQLPQVQVSVVTQKIGDYNGPGCNMDLVFLGNSSYYFRDTYQEEIEKALGWLSPTGHLIDITDNIRDMSLQNQLGASSEVSQSEECKSECSQSEGGKSEGGSCMPNKRKALMAWCWENGWSVEGQLSETEYDLDYTFDVTDPGMEQVFQFLINTVLEEVEMKRITDDKGVSIIKGTTRVPGKQLITIISHAKSEDTTSDQLQMKAKESAS